jgi:AhpD family alkylhydroperoxidase
MSRLAPARPRGLDPVRRVIYSAARRLYGRALEPTQVIAHHRPLLVGYSTMALFGDRYSRSVDRQLKELAMLRTAQLIECEWCLDFGSWLACRAGVPEAQLRQLAVWRQSELFGPVERLVLEYTEAMTRTPVEVPDELFAGLRAHFNERQMVELTMSIGLENLYSRTNHAMGLGGEGYSEGIYCVRPERRFETGDLEAVSGAR